MTEPTVSVPLSEAIQDLTGFEVLGVQRHYNLAMEELGGVRTLCGAVWAYRNRTEKTDWSTVEQMSLRELSGFFAVEDPDQDSSAQGKDPSGSETPPDA